MRDYTKLRAFELADEVALLIYQAIRKFPKEEIYGLTSQMRRANAQRLTAFSLQPKNLNNYKRYTYPVEPKKSLPSLKNILW
ncbi:MAG TPA: four helix bundle protein [Desulfatiglandales bacterium]|nr:four helix bundle protein [Desulfatiglandales bacterium]